MSTGARSVSHSRIYAVRECVLRNAGAALIASALGVAPAGAFGAAASCAAQSGPNTVALVELYTSEGCDSCPPADRWLSSLGSRAYAPDKVVPLALHVDYWDYIGWKDPYARRTFSERQRALAAKRRAGFVYTPQVVLQGRDFRGWSGSGFDAAVSRVNGTPAEARIALEMLGRDADALDVQVSAELLDPRLRTEAVLFVAAFESRLVSRVLAGENRDKTLRHDYVVRAWHGPIGFGQGLRFAERRRLPLPPGVRPDRVGVAAFIENRRSADVIQALMLEPCPGASG